MIIQLAIVRIRSELSPIDVIVGLLLRITETFRYLSNLPGTYPSGQLLKLYCKGAY